MSLDRFLKDTHGLRKYVELMESTPTNKRKLLMDAARTENEQFITMAEKYILTFDRISKLPDMEVTEVFGATGLKPNIIAIAISSIEDVTLREKVKALVPRNLAVALAQEWKDSPVPKPNDIGSARLQIIKRARELEKEGRLESIQIPLFGKDYFNTPVQKAA